MFTQGFFKADLANAHSADADVAACARVFFKLGLHKGR
jgi:hypothetical protein